jgi:N-glycosylase/DNA lyase
MAIAIEEYNEGIVIKNVSDFELKHIFECGQCFRWNAQRDGSYTGVAGGRAARLIKQGNDVCIRGGMREDEEFWKHYLDLNRDYGIIKDELSEDEILREAIGHGQGIRILNQDPFETLVSFIISANNRIPMIKKAVENISKMYGREMEFDGARYYSFPDPDALAEATVEELEGCGCGFRAGYIADTTKKITSGEVDLSKIMKTGTDEAHEELMKLKGIGPKVADCILLFSMQKYDAFPVDVWVKRIMQYFYLAPDVSLKKIRDYGRDKFGDYAGFAQQYLFYYARELKIKDIIA